MQDAQAACEAIRLYTFRTLADGGYLERIAADRALGRWYRYVCRLGVRGLAPGDDPLAQPRIFPMMDGLAYPPWREASEIPAAALLEKNADVFRNELESVSVGRYLDYPGGIVENGHWTVLPLFVFGEEAASVLYPESSFRETVRLIRELPDACADLPLADIVFSAHAPRTHLTAHCSWDPFRLRLHLGIRVPEGCRIRVGAETREWQQGKVLAFHDAYEHETWNDGDDTRLVLIVDLWNPDLTPAERRAILACFRKREIRDALMRTRAPSATRELFAKRFRDGEARDPLIAEFWRR